MSFFDLFEFVFRFNLSASDTATWIYVVLIFVGFIVGVGLIWGRFWNREWSLGGHIGSFVLIVIFALLASYSVFNLRTIARIEEWFSGQRIVLARSVADSGRFNRSVLRATWSELAPNGGQEGLTSPEDAGNELRLNNPEEAMVLAVNAADEARSVLRSKPPFLFGVPLSTKSPQEIAAEAVDAIHFDAGRYPTTVAATNAWSTTAATIQANHALDTALARLKPELSDLKTACVWLLIVSIALPVAIIPVAALGDIRINPVPKR